MNSNHVSIRFISSQEIEATLKYDDLIPAIEKSLADFSRRKAGGVVQPPRTVLPIEENNGVFFAMPCYSRTQDSLACKLLTRFPPAENVSQIPRIRTITAMFDTRNGSLQAILDSEAITSMRTAAASAVATKYLAPDNSKVLAILGAGLQAKAHLDALSHVIKFSEVRVWNRTLARAEAFADKYGCVAYTTAEEAVNNADVIATVTSSHTPILWNDWVKDGAHVNCVGAVRDAQQELDPALVRRAVIYTDSKECALKESGDIIKAEADVFGEIGEVSLGKLQARKNDTTIFKSLGMAVEDLVSAKLVCDELLAGTDSSTGSKS